MPISFHNDGMEARGWNSSTYIYNPKKRKIEDDCWRWLEMMFYLELEVVRKSWISIKSFIVGGDFYCLFLGGDFRCFFFLSFSSDVTGYVVSIQYCFCWSFTKNKIHLIGEFDVINGMNFLNFLVRKKYQVFGFTVHLVMLFQ